MITPLYEVNMIDKSKWKKIDWSQFKSNGSETVMDTNNNIFTAELPDDKRELYSDKETIPVDRRV